MQGNYSMELGGRTLSIEIGKVAKQAGGAALVRYGETVLLVTATGSKQPRAGIDFFPLTVDYEERLYAVGKIPGGFIKREGRPSEKAILSARLIDRPIRPLFPEGFRNDVQISALVLSVDQDNPPEIVALNGASIALSVSDIPFMGPIGGVIVGRINGEFIANPTYKQSLESDMHIVVAGTKDAVMMVEAGIKEVPEDVVLQAIAFGHEEIKKIVAFQESFIGEIAKPKMEVPLYVIDPEIAKMTRDYATEKLHAAIQIFDKKEREDAISAAKEDAIKYMFETLGEEVFAEKAKNIDDTLYKIVKERVREAILNEGIRPDGRKTTEVRPITCEVGLLKRTHGTGLFTRGQTQVLTVATLGAVGEEQILDGLGAEESKRYMHHYNFPPYSVGEVKPMRGPGRREIGHGALAERALEPVIPGEADFPYTIRLVSEVLESNGSTSMGSVCGSTLALMDAGVPISAPVSGVAMGLITEGERFSILTDIQGMEDFLGDMDFKVAGTEKGITALQMDMKVKGISMAVLEKALAQAKEGRMHILGKMLEAIQEPRKELSPYAPRIIKMQIDPDKIKDVIGPGGKMIKKIIEETNVKIDIEDDGRVFIASIDPEAGKKAMRVIESITKDIAVGTIYLGKVTRIMNFGAFVEVAPGKEGLVHISQLSKERVQSVESVVKVGDEILVKVTEIDKQGRINLTCKGLRPEEDGEQNNEN